jgi:RimJ/RimL family protein N-acetyltransferase
MKQTGEVVPGLACFRPDLRTLAGRYVRLEKLSVELHGKGLYASIEQAHADMWLYLLETPNGFSAESEFLEWLRVREARQDLWFYAYVNPSTGLPEGVGSFMRLDLTHACGEVGHIWFSPALQRTRRATEAIFLMIQHAFEVLGLRRLEWKCDALNEASRRAALRFGFSFEGIFRQHYIVKGRNRDTSWYAIIDKDWPTIQARFLRWLEPSNFTGDGQEIVKLRDA